MPGSAFFLAKTMVFKFMSAYVIGSSKFPSRQTIGIIGAAIAGPTFALQILSHPILRRLYKPVIYDQRANVQSPDSERSLQTAGAAIGLLTNGLYPLYQLGLKDAINGMSAELSEVRL